MSEVNIGVGKRIRNFRKMRNLTLEELSKLINKSPSTLSKYEKGQISIDIETLYEIAEALSVHVEQLLYIRQKRTHISNNNSIPAFFRGASQFYSYIFDGRTNKIIRCVFDVLSEIEVNNYNIMVYMNFENFEEYQNCENIYWGTIEHFDAVTNIVLRNQDTPMERGSAQILASYLESNTKWGLWNGFSSRPMMPISTKMLFSKEPLKEDEKLIDQLKISKEDIRVMKSFNMLCVT